MNLESGEKVWAWDKNVVVISIYKELKVKRQNEIIEKAITDRQEDQGQSVEAVQSL